MKLVIDQTPCGDDIYRLVEEEGEISIQEQYEQLMKGGMSYREARKEIKKYPVSHEQMTKVYEKGEGKIK